MDKEIKELIALKAIENLMIRYAERIDANDPEGAAACFAEDGVGHYWGKYKGRKDIARRLAGILDRFSATSHHLTNTSIRLDGDSATAMSYVYAFHRMADTGNSMHYWGRWVDSLVKIDNKWYFAEREVVGVGSITPDNPELDKKQPGHPGRLER